MSINPFNTTRNLENTHYIVRSSDKPYARMISGHRTLGEAYKTLVRYHKEHYKYSRFVMAQRVITIIATESPKDVIEKDIEFWATLEGRHPRSVQRLPLPIVVHQWQPEYKIYLRFGEIKTS